VLRTNTIDAHTREGLFSAHRHVAVVATLVGVMFIATTLPTPLYVIYEHTFRFSRVTLTLVYAVYVVGNLVALLLLGRTSDIIGRRKVSLAAIAIAMVSTIFFLFARDTAWLFWARIFNGVAVGLTAGTATAWITELDPNQDRARCRHHDDQQFPRPCPRFAIGGRACSVRALAAQIDVRRLPRAIGGVGDPDRPNA
jgi:hypothetical protein